MDGKFVMSHKQENDHDHRDMAQESLYRSIDQGLDPIHSCHQPPFKQNGIGA